MATAKRTAVMDRFRALKNQGIAGDSARNQNQQNILNEIERNRMNSQGGISNMQPGDVSFGNRSQVGQGSAYNMYPTGSWNDQFARYWDPLNTGNQDVDRASGQVVGQFAQIERALEPNMSRLIDTSSRLDRENRQRLGDAMNEYRQGNQRIQGQSDEYFQGLGDYLVSEQGAQQAFAANEARRATGSAQAAQAAGTRVGGQFVGQSLEARQRKMAEDRALANELANYIRDYNASVKASGDQYDLATVNQLLEIQRDLAMQLGGQQVGLIGQNLGFNLNDIAAQRALVRELAARQSSTTGSSGGVFMK